jgi:type I restriction enzyme M protein
MFADFEACFGKDPNGGSKRVDQGETGRFRAFGIEEIKERGYKLDIKWLKDEGLDDPDDLPEPGDLIAEAVTELQAAMDELEDIAALIGKEEA